MLGGKGGCDISNATQLSACIIPTMFSFTLLEITHHRQHQSGSVNRQPADSTRVGFWVKFGQPDHVSFFGKAEQRMISCLNYICRKDSFQHAACSFLKLAQQAENYVAEK